MSSAKPFVISKDRVLKAFELVKANAGSAGVDGQSLEEFGENLKANLYKIWNRMSSGSYFPPPVKAVEIPKVSGGTRVLGVPTVADRVAQMVVKLEFEPLVEPIFLPDSFGYRPGKSALDAIGVTRKRCWKFDWILEFDIRGLFDNIRHDLLSKAMRHHTDCRWVLLYIERWLVAPIRMPDGTQEPREKGIPQGGVVSPVLSNLFLHYAFDAWMTREFPEVRWCRYADDGVVHCRTKEEAQVIRAALEERLSECGLELHPKKTKIVYCKDDRRTGDHQHTSFDFLGYTFRPRSVKNQKQGTLFVGFTPAVSKSALKAMRSEIRWFRRRSDFSLSEIARLLNPKLRGWMAYYGRYYPSAMYAVWRHFNTTLVAWAMQKFKSLRRRKTQAGRFLERIAQRDPRLFYHWSIGMVGVFV
jgi:group II intron reverse transcriptase/maturase